MCAVEEVEANNNCPCAAVSSQLQTDLHADMRLCKYMHVFMYLSKFALEECEVR